MTLCKVIVFSLICTLKNVEADVFPALPYGRLMTRFNNVITNIHNNNGVATDTDRSILERLKEDMLEDCAAGRLEEDTVYDEYDFRERVGVAAKTYRVMVSEQVTRDRYYWVLPEVDCNGAAGRGSQRSPAVIPTTPANFQVYPALPYGRLMNKFNEILRNTEANEGVIPPYDRDTLRQLKQDILEDCSTGKLQVNNGYNENDFQNDAGIPTKVYRVMVSLEVTQDLESWVLPSVDCDGARRLYQ